MDGMKAPTTGLLIIALIATALQPAFGLTPDDVSTRIETGDPNKDSPSEDQSPPAQDTAQTAQEGQPEQSGQESSETPQNPSDSVHAHAASGAFLLASGDFIGAIVELRHALRLQPDYVKARVDLGSALYQVGDIDSAVETYREALRWDADLVQARVSLATALIAKHEWGQARHQLETAVKLQPNMAQAHYNLGGVRYTMGDHGGAIEAYRQALQLRPDYADAHYNLGLVLKLSNYETEATYEFLAAAISGVPQAQYFAGSAYASGVGVERNQATAIEWWFRAADQDEAQAKEALAELRRVALHKGEHSSDESPTALKAFEDYRKGLWNQNPRIERQDDDELVGTCLLREGRIQEAVTMLIHEASALSDPAHSLLETLYEQGLEGKLAPYDAWILTYLKTAADEGLPLPRLTLARAYARGLGVPQDLHKATGLLKGLSGEKAKALLKEIYAMPQIGPQAAQNASPIR